MEIIKLLEKNKPNNYTGQDVYRRYEFQMYFAADLLLKCLRDSNNNKTVLMDYFDDVVLLDDFSNPKCITFYQVKTNENFQIKISTMFNKNFFKKLFDELSTFKSVKSSAVFVTNGRITFNFDNIKGDNRIKGFKEIDFSNLSITSIHDFLKDNSNYEKIKDIFEKNFGDINLNDFCLLKTDFTIDDFENVFLGKITKFTTEKYPYLDSVAITAIEQDIMQFIRNKQKPNYNPIVIKYDELIEKKAVSTENIKSIFDDIARVSIPVDLTEILNFNDNYIKYIFDDNIVNLYEKYSNFKNHIMQYKDIIDYVFKECNSIVISPKEVNIVQNYYLSLISNDIISDCLFFKENYEFIILIYLYKKIKGQI